MAQIPGRDGDTPHRLMPPRTSTVGASDSKVTIRRPANFAGAVLDFMSLTRFSSTAVDFLPISECPAPGHLRHHAALPGDNGAGLGEDWQGIAAFTALMAATVGNRSDDEIRSPGDTTP
jgi:hypothetical protein